MAPEGGSDAQRRLSRRAYVTLLAGCLDEEEGDMSKQSAVADDSLDEVNGCREVVAKGRSPASTNSALTDHPRRSASAVIASLCTAMPFGCSLVETRV
jgi:hypothetical protein